MCSIYRCLVFIYKVLTWQHNEAILVIFPYPCKRDRFDTLLSVCKTLKKFEGKTFCFYHIVVSVALDFILQPN